MPRRLMAAVCALALAPMFVACGDDDGGSGVSSQSPGSTSTSASAAVSTAAPKLSGPASKYSVSIDDLGITWITDIKGTFVIDDSGYGKVPSLFQNAAEGSKRLKEWNYDSGYETAYSPEGRDDAVLKGGYYIMVESHLFKDEAGANKAFDYFTQFIGTYPGAQPVQMPVVGNKSAAYVTTTGKIAGTTANAVFHQVISVRGNLVTIILTRGAEGFMKVDYARALAAMADEKALGKRAAVEPTSTANFQTPTPTQKQ